MQTSIIASDRICVAMNGNANYPTPFPALADVAKARTSFVAAVSAANSGPRSVVVRRQQRAQLVVLLRSLSLYVQQACDGDPAILLTSGYPVRRTRQPHAGTAARTRST